MNYIPKTRQAIFAELMALKSNYPSLDILQTQNINDEQTLFERLTTTTKVALWILWIHIVSIAMWINQFVLYNGILEQEEIRDTSNFGNRKWCAYTIKKFQDGDEVFIDTETNKIVYDTIDETAQIIENASAQSVTNAALIKVRRKNTDILSNDEKTRLDTYWKNVGVLGVNYIIQNSDADLMKLIGSIKYKGEKNQIDIQTIVESTINDYLKNLTFNGEFIKNNFIKSILSIDGIIDFEISTMQAKSANGIYEDVIYRYIPVAGYLKIDTNYPLNTNISYKIEYVY